MMIDPRVVMYLVWGGATLAVYLFVFLVRLRSWQRHHDARAKREVLSALALLMAAIAAASGVVLAVLGIMPDLRSFVGAMSLAGFLAAGLVMASQESGHREP